MMPKQSPSKHPFSCPIPPLILLTWAVIGCGNQVTNTSFTQTTTTTDTNQPLVVATTSLLCDLTRQIAEHTVNLYCLTPTPSTYQPQPQDIQALKQASLILYGTNRQPEIVNLIQREKNPAAKIAPTPPQPYNWHNPRNTNKIVETISNHLTELQPESATTFTNNTQLLQNELTLLDTWINQRISTIPQDKRKLVTTNDNIRDYAQAYKIPLVLTLNSIKTQEKPTASEFKTWVRSINQTQVPTIFAETNLPNLKILEYLAQEANVQLSRRTLYINDLSEPETEADTYQKMMIANTRTIVEGLGGTYLKFTSN